MEVQIFEIPDCQHLGDLLHFESVIRNASGIVDGHIYSEEFEEGWIRYRCPSLAIQRAVEIQLQTA